MWSRKDIKSYAKSFLKRHYLKAFLVCIIAWVLSGGITNNASLEKNSVYNNWRFNDDKVTVVINGPFSKLGFERMGLSFKFDVAKGLIPVAFLSSLLLTLFVGNVAEVGVARYFLKGFKEEDADTNDMFSAFKEGEYLEIVKTQFFRGLYNFLWTLVFIIPGIVKSYEYKMVPYIISKDPNMYWNDAIKSSRHMTEGHKMNMFILDLSFLGWHLLGTLFFGIGGIFVIPYQEAAYARLYNVLSGEKEDEIETDYEII